MSGQAAALAQALARHAEAVCRYYLPNGRRHGGYWLVGDINNTPGRSLYIRLAGPDYGPGAAGKWTDAATGEHGDLLDLIAANRGLEDFRKLCDEVGRFLSLPRREFPPCQPPAPQGSPEAARPGYRLRERMQKPICALGASLSRSTACRCASIPRSGIGVTVIPAASPGQDCLPPSPMRAAGSPVFIAPGSIGSALRRRRCLIRAGRSGISSAMACASAVPSRPRRRPGFSSPARGSRPCCRSNPSCPACRWSRPCRPTISRRWNSRRVSPGCMSRKTETRRATRRPNDSAPAGKPPPSRFVTWCRFGGTSTRIYAGQVLKPYSPGSWTSLLRMMSRSSCGFKARLSAADPIPAIAERQQDVADG
jgi:hypothetical protein